MVKNRVKGGGGRVKPGFWFFAIFGGIGDEVG
jgi:hypothetical protein